MNKHLKEIEKILTSHKISDPEYKAFRDKVTNLKTLGLRLPIIQAITRDGFAFYEKSCEEILGIWNHVWNKASLHETMYLPLFYYRNKKADLGLKEWEVLKSWIDRIDNWEHADALIYLYSFLLEKHPKQIYPTMVKWNKSKNPWKRRASIVSLIYYASKNRSTPPVKDILPLVKNLLSDLNPYVQKGIGWTLRECGKVYPKETWQFLQDHILDLSAIAFSYSTEKISAADKTKLKKMRKKR